MSCAPPVYNDDVTVPGSVRQVASADFPTQWGTFRIYGFEATPIDALDQTKEEAVALVMGDLGSAPLWFAFTLSASRVMSLPPCGATAVSNLRWLLPASLSRARAS